MWAVGGSSGLGLLNSVEVYSPELDQWEPGPPLPRPLWDAQALSWDGNLWLLGGHTDNGTNEKVCCISVTLPPC